MPLWTPDFKYERTTVLAEESHLKVFYSVDALHSTATTLAPQGTSGR